MDSYAGSDQVSGMVFSHKGDERFTNFAAQDPEFIRIGCTAQNAQVIFAFRFTLGSGDRFLYHFRISKPAGLRRRR